MGVGFALSTVLAADRATVWAHAASLSGINAELAPLRMSAPPDLLGPDGLERLMPHVPGRALFTSWITLGGVLPLGRHSVGIERIEPGVGFQERSTSMLLRDWRHVRMLEDAEGGTRLTDQIWLETRLPGLDRLLVGLYRNVFRRRHALLRRRFGAPAGA